MTFCPSSAPESETDGLASTGFSVSDVAVVDSTGTSVFSPTESIIFTYEAGNHPSWRFLPFP